jgi:hypothetical protein
MSRVSPSEVSVTVAEPRALLAAAVVAAARPAGCANALTPRQGPAGRWPPSAAPHVVLAVAPRRVP